MSSTSFKKCLSLTFCFICTSYRAASLVALTTRKVYKALCDSLMLQVVSAAQASGGENGQLLPIGSEAEGLDLFCVLLLEHCDTCIHAVIYHASKLHRVSVSHCVDVVTALHARHRAELVLQRLPSCQGLIHFSQSMQRYFDLQLYSIYKLTPSGHHPATTGKQYKQMGVPSAALSLMTCAWQCVSRGECLVAVLSPPVHPCHIHFCRVL